MLRFRVDDLPPNLRRQAMEQICPSTRTAGKATAAKSGKSAPIRPSIRMARKPVQSSAERMFNSSVLGGRGRYEAITLNLPGGARYTADFLVRGFGDANPSTLVLYEVKGSYRLPSHGRAATAFKTACALFPEFIFVWAELQKDGRTWIVTPYRDGFPIGKPTLVSSLPQATADAS